jgi:hypothetical protein
MTNENDAVDIKNNENELDLDKVEAQAEETTEKPVETPEAKLARLKRQVAQQEKKLGLTEEQPESKSKSGDLDWGQKAFLNTYGIKGSDELQLVREYLGLGKSLDDIPSNKHFLNDLTELRDARLVKQAIPSGTARANNSPRDSVEYWVAKGELPPANQVQLRRDVLNARIKAEKNSTVFSDNPIIQT